MPELFGDGREAIDIRHLTVEPPEKAKEFEFDYRKYLTPSDWQMIESARRSLGFSRHNHNGIEQALAMTDMDLTHRLLQDVRDREAELLGILHGDSPPYFPLQIFITETGTDSFDERVLLLLRRAGITHPHLDAYAYQVAKQQIDALFLPANQTEPFGFGLLHHLTILFELFPELNQPELEAAAGQRMLNLIDRDPDHKDQYDLIEYSSLVKRVFPSLFERVVSEYGNWQQNFLDNFLDTQRQVRKDYANLYKDTVEPVLEGNVHFRVHEMTLLAAWLTTISRTEKGVSEGRDELPEQRKY